MIQIDNISKQFNKSSKFAVKALDKVSCTIQTNKVSGLIGTNGAGKTTLIRILLGFEKQDTGEITIDGLNNLSIEARKLIGYQSDLPYLSKSMKVADYLHLNSILAGFKDNEQQISELLEYFKLSTAYHKGLSDLSKGMRQKLEIINAFLGNPKIVILDEPTAALDPVATLELREFINKKRNTGITILFSSHHLSEVEHICDNVFLIDSGKIHRELDMNTVERGTLEEEFRKFISEQK
ncbi:MAG TPA: ABC transporter ATP-binding protein [Candidatus Kapabacteria bacterium]|nr:ABC transporter ATP-binding protein [Candidatus Kapabacteria bacterium]